MSIYEINTRDFVSSPNFTWSAMIRKFESENKTKNYEIVDRNLVTPINIRYSMTVSKVSPLNSGSISQLTSIDNTIVINEPTLEDFLNSVKNNVELIKSYYEWINASVFDTKDEDEIKLIKRRYFDTAMKVTSIKPFITETTESVDELVISVNDNVVIESEMLDIDRILEIVDNHPEIENIKLAIKIREEEMKRLILENQNRDREMVRQNNYEMWKLLNEKYINGEFNDFIK
jgi:hypothetical protein